MHASGAARSGATWPGRTNGSHADGLLVRQVWVSASGLVTVMSGLHPVVDGGFQAPSRRPRSPRWGVVLRLGAARRSSQAKGDGWAKPTGSHARTEHAHS